MARTTQLRFPMPLVAAQTSVALGGLLLLVLATAPLALAQRETKLTASDGAASDFFGHRVAISGDHMVVGAWGDDGFRGSVYVFRRSGATWLQEARLTASDRAAEDQFGYSIAISGDDVVVGAHGAEAQRGAAYVFRRSGTVWTQQAKLTTSDGVAGDGFGYSVAIEGDDVVVGAVGDDAAQGSAYMFRRGGTAWTQQAKLTASDAVTGDQFGYSVALNGDDVAVGAWATDDWGIYSGSAYVFHRSGATWTQQARLTASDAAALDYFGASVALSGDHIAVGSLGDDNSRGSAYVFRRNGTAWAQQGKLTASDRAPNDQFGQGIAIDGDDVAVGAPGDDNYRGSAYVFDYTVVAGQPDPVPGAFAIRSLYPNPVQSQAHIQLEVALPSPSAVQAEVYDRLGRCVLATRAQVGAGVHPLALDTGALAPGVYVVRVMAGSDVASHRITVLH